MFEPFACSEADWLEEAREPSVSNVASSMAARASAREASEDLGGALGELYGIGVTAQALSSSPNWKILPTAEQSSKILLPQTSPMPAEDQEILS